MSAAGGSGSTAGSPGTVYTWRSGINTYGNLLVYNTHDSPVAGTAIRPALP